MFVMSKMNRSTKHGLFFILGAAAGAAAAWYLNSDEGRELRRKSAKAMSEWSDKASGEAQELYNQGKHYAEDLATRFNKKNNDSEVVAEDLMGNQN